MPETDSLTLSPAVRLDALNGDLLAQVYDVQAIIALAKSAAWNEGNVDGREAAAQLGNINRSLDVASKLLDVLADRIDGEVKLVPAEVANG